MEKPKKVKPGIEAFLENYLGLVEGKRVGLITNPTGVNSHRETNIDLFYANSKINLVALYGPEHGVRGNAPAGEYVPFTMDEKYNLPVFSLYGQSMKPEAETSHDIDEHMRSFDISKIGKAPENSMIENLDVMIFDMQDVGTRIYTYIATMAYCMQAKRSGYGRTSLGVSRIQLFCWSLSHSSEAWNDCGRAFELFQP
jgi:uncharacterized protein YbbC (DUF1343 family)